MSNAYPEDNLIGVEIEAEFSNEKSISFPSQPKGLTGWRFERDGSLRGTAIEFVTNEPNTVDVVETQILALYDWFTSIRKAGITLNDSMRAGIHIHVNQKERTYQQVLTFCCLYWILEELLVDAFCGAERAGNLFCLRLIDADYGLNHLQERLVSGQKSPFATERSNSIRYSGLNLVSLSKFGSLEFRSLRTPLSPEPVLEWIRVLQLLRIASLDYRNPAMILEAISGDNPVDFVYHLFAGQATPLARLNLSQIESSVMRGVRLIQSFVFTTNWS